LGSTFEYRSDTEVLSAGLLARSGDKPQISDDNKDYAPIQVSTERVRRIPNER
jgi:hypothetical protein